MIDELRKRADISYEEARDILEQADGNLLEAVVLLEQQSKLRQPESSESEGRSSSDSEASGESFNKADGNAAEDSVKASAKKNGKGALGKAFHSAGNFLAHTSFHISHAGKEILVMPSWTFALLLFFFWHVMVPFMLIALFFNVRYFFDGTPETEAANEILYKAGSFAEGFEESMNKEN